MPKYLPRLTALCLAMAVALPAVAEEVPPPPPTVADDPAAMAAEAERVGELGRVAYREGRYAEAYVAFEQAFALDQKPAWLYNMAKIKEKLADYTAAVELLDRYVAAFRKQNNGADPPNATDVANMRRDFEQRAYTALPEVTVVSTPSGAQILLGANGPTLGSTPLTTHMKPGRYPLVLRLADHDDLQTELVVPLSGTVRVVLSLNAKVRRAALTVWANVRGAQIAVDGKVVAVTPFVRNIDVEPGRHQVTLQRAGYHPVEDVFEIPQDRLLSARFVLKRIDSPTTWRTWLGWPLLVSGGALIGGGAVASYFADKEFAGSPWFNKLEQWQNLGYRGGGSAVGLGLVLLVWDGVREAIPSEELVDGVQLNAGSELTVLDATDLRR